MRVVVVGAGVVGSAVSYRLAEAGAAVTTIERAFPGSGVSGATFAWINAFGGAPRRQYCELKMNSIAAHKTLANEVGGNWLHLDGGLHWPAAEDPKESVEMQSKYEQLTAWGYRMERVSPEVVMRDLEPDLAIDIGSVASVYLALDEGWLGPLEMCHALLQTAEKRHSLKFERGRVTGISRSAARVDGVILDDGRRLAADVIVNAAGPDAALLSAMAGGSLALRREAGLLVVTNPAPICLRHVVHAPQCHIQPRGAAQLVLHMARYDSSLVGAQHDEVPDQTAGEIGERAVRDAQMVIPGLHGARAGLLAVGIRPIPPDGLPVVGFDPAAPGLYNAVTHSGITLSAILATLISEDLAGVPTALLEPYRPERLLVGATP